MLEPELCKTWSEYCHNLWCKNGTKNIQIKKVYSIEIIKVTIFPTRKKLFKICKSHHLTVCTHLIIYCPYKASFPRNTKILAEVKLTQRFKDILRHFVNLTL